MDHLLLLLLLWSSGLGGGGSLVSAAAQCEEAKADIMMLVDESGNINSSYFRIIQEAVKEIIKTFSIGPDSVQIGLTLFGDTLRTIWDLNTYQTKETMLKVVDSLRQRGGSIQTGLALEDILYLNFQLNEKMSQDSRKILVLFAHGDSKDNVEQPVKDLRDSGIEVYVIGIGDVSDCQVSMMASDVHHIYTVKDCSSLLDIVNNVTNSLCDSATSRDSVRLVNGTSLCSGRLEVTFDQPNQPNQGWSSVCEADFDLQDAEVVCRELGCGAPSVLRGALYGEVEAPWWTKEFQCGGRESALKDCRSSDTNTCSPGRAAGLTCSEPVRLVGGASRCAGVLQVKLREWRMVDAIIWSLKTAAAACKELDCGSAVSVGTTEGSTRTSVWRIMHDCVQDGYSLKDCASADSSTFSILNITCSDSVRLVNGTSLCSGRLEVRFDQPNQPNQGWSSVCEAHFDLKDAEVVCRELGCGAPSVLRGVLYGEVEAPLWTKEFQCGGRESALKDCRSSDTNTCSPGRAAGLTCSEPVRLVGGASRCAGVLQVKLGEWGNVYPFMWSLKTAAAACKELDCGSAVSVGTTKGSSETSMWWIWSNCVEDGRSLRECSELFSSNFTVELVCSDLLEQPIISVSSVGGVSRAQQQGFRVFRGSSFTLSCSVRPQYPGGSFQLSFTSSSTTLNHTQPAVNHSAHFLFPAADYAHRGSYTCIYHLHVFSHNFSSESRQLSLVVSDPTVFFIRLLLLLLSLLLFTSLICFSHKIAREQKKKKRGPRKDVEEEQLAVCRAEEEVEGSSK